MRTILAFIFLLIFLTQCFNDRNNDLELKINSISKAIDDTLKELSWNAKFHKLSLSLENNTDSTIHFWMYTCSWDRNFITNYQNISIIGTLECPRNFPKLFDIEVNSRMNFDGLLAIDDTFDLNKMIKIGFIYIDEDEESRIIEISPFPPGDSVALKKHNTHDRIIWSEPFMIK